MGLAGLRGTECIGILAHHKTANRHQKWFEDVRNTLFNLMILGNQLQLGLDYMGVRQNPGSQVNIAHLPVP